MKYFLFFSIIAVLIISCKNTQNSSTKTKQTYWSKTETSQIPEKYSKFKVYSLNIKNFISALESGTVLLPNDMGVFNTFEVKESSTMSSELAAKFPELKAYKGNQSDNELCKTSIERNKTKLKIAVFCNDKTYFIDQDKSTGFFIVYNKANAPTGVGLVNEK